MESESEDRIELRTERLLLRPFRFGDVDDIVVMGGFPRWDLSGPMPYTQSHAEELVAQTDLASWRTNPRFAIVMEDKVIGSVSLAIKWENETAEIGFSLDKKYWGKGITTEAVRAVVSWAFRGLGLAKVSSHADIRNVRSWRLMTKVGMVREGVFRREEVIRGVRTSIVWYAILREEWTQNNEAEVL